MSAPSSQPFAKRGTKADLEDGLSFQPKFDGDGLIPAIVTDAHSGEVRMFAFMNAHALKLSIDTGVAHFWSRSRASLWKKGEESGNFLNIVEMRTDCDQDVIWVRVSVAGDGRACHTGERSCFYRVLKPGSETGEAASLAVAPDACRHD